MGKVLSCVLSYKQTSLVLSLLCVSVEYSYDLLLEEDLRSGACRRYWGQTGQVCRLVGAFAFHILDSLEFMNNMYADREGPDWSVQMWGLVKVHPACI